MEEEWKGSEKDEIITTDLNYHLQTRELAAQKDKKKNQNEHTHKKSRKQPNTQTWQTKTKKITKSTKYQEKTIYAYFKESTPKSESQSHDVSLKIHF